jgi:hypothetical protein
MNYPDGDQHRSLFALAGTRIFVRHENHLPAGAFRGSGHVRSARDHLAPASAQTGRDWMEPEWNAAVANNGDQARTPRAVWNDVAA